jgi:hypothetical protein
LICPAEQGEVDWNTLGNKVTEHLLAESQHVSRVDNKYGAVHTAEGATAQSANEWQFDYEKNGIVVFRKKNKSSKLTSFCGRGVVNAPYTTVAEFIKDIESTFVWDKYVVEARHLKTFSKSSTHFDYLGYQMHSASHCFSLVQRDMLFFIRCLYTDDKYVQSAISVEDDDYPPQKYRPRCDMHLGTGCVVESFRGRPNSCLITLFANIDLKGIPLFLMTQVLRRYPMAIQCIQRAFSSRQSPQRSLTPPSPSLPSTQDQPFTVSTRPYEEDVSLSAFVGRVNKQKAPDVDPK